MFLVIVLDAGGPCGGGTIRGFVMIKVKEARLCNWMEKRFWLHLSSPDGNSNRTLVFITRPKKNPFKGIKLWSWRNKECVKFELWLNKLGLYPSW